MIATDQPHLNLEWCRCGLPFKEDLVYRRDGQAQGLDRRMFRCMSGHTVYLGPVERISEGSRPYQLQVVPTPLAKRCAACREWFSDRNRRKRVCKMCRKRYCPTCRKWGGFHRPGCGRTTSS